MRRSLAFIHAADLHLGSPLKSLHASDPRIGQNLAQALWRAYDRLIAEAVRRKVDFVAISGDVLDDTRPSYSCVMHFIDGMQALCYAGIPVYLATGNHDRLDAWQQGFAPLPRNVTLFSGEQPGFAVFGRDGQALATIAGKGFSDAFCADDVLRMGSRSARRATKADAAFHIALLHTGLDADRRTCPVSPAQLLQADVDYWALGHIHKRSCNDASNPRLAFPGCIQGRDINEPGDCGCLLVNLVEGASNQIEFIPLSSISWERVSVDASAMRSVAQVQSEIEAMLADVAGECASDQLIARVSLTGRGPLHGVLSREQVREDLRERINNAGGAVFCDSIECRMVSVVDRDLLYDQGLFPAALLSSMDALRGDSQALNNLIEREFASRMTECPQYCEADLGVLVDTAEELVLDLLAGDRRGW